ncbi:cardioacceleratory peptide receptor-like [Bacillus rossius redtenbacheri]|uniref:cardioacceleratory peptide receptor-like n=1 Tax=Bacillus rossius redtenbacheri TaxID=93214 RepID=UPI002FDCF8C6
MAALLFPAQTSCFSARCSQAVVTYSSTYVLNLSNTAALLFPAQTSCCSARCSQAVVTYSSTYVLVALSIDRYDAITHPMNFTGSWRLQCWIDFSEPWQWQVYMTLVALTLFVGPALIISACYTVIVSTIWSKSRQLTTEPAGVTGGSRSSRGSGHGSGKSKPALRMPRLQQLQSEDQDSRRASSKGLIPKAKVKTVKMTFVIVFVFVVCWSPYIVFDLLQVYGHVPRTQTNIAVASFIQSLAPLNSAANPVIYCLFSASIGRTLRKVPPFSWVAGLCCKSEGSSSDAEHPTFLAASARWESSRRRGKAAAVAAGAAGAGAAARTPHPHLDVAARGAVVTAVASIV